MHLAPPTADSGDGGGGGGGSAALGEPVDGSPASVLVVGGPCHAPSCVLSGPALRGAPGEALTISAAERVV